MCLRPIKIFNNTNSLRPIDQTSFDVCCGECEECQNLRRSEYTFRIFAQMQECFRKGWNVYFGTLTYSEVPELVIYPNFETLSFACFRKQDVISFFKRIRKWALQKFGVKGIVYCCASEYGHSTKRPHYHFMLSLPPEIDPQTIHDYVCNIWHHGFVFPRYLNGGKDNKGYDHRPFQVLERDCHNASFYIAKYCCKDLAFYAIPEVKKAQQYLKDTLKTVDIDVDTYETCTRLLHQNFTFVVTSRHFGDCINNLCTSVDDFFNGVEAPFSKKLLPIPNFNRRKLLFKVRRVSDDPTIKVDSFDRFGNIVKKYKVRYDLTDFGKRVFSEHVRKSVSSVITLLRDFCNVHLDTYDFDTFLNEKSFKFDKDLFRSKVRELSVYSVVYRNRCSPLHMQEYYDFPHIYNKKLRVIPESTSYFRCGLTWTMNTDVFCFRGDETLSYMCNVADRFYLTYLDYDKYLDEGKINVKDVHNIKSVHFNSFDCFRGFDVLLDVIYSYLVFIRSDKVKYRHEHNLQKQICKQEMTETNY